MAGTLLVNPRSGDGRCDDLVAEAERLGLHVRVLAPDDDPVELARTAEGPVGVAGGDGSLAAVASVCAERDVPFVCVPFGTRNHFARDVGLDRSDPFAALAAFTDGEERRVDLGRANDRAFLNNVSLGTYARLVHRRERHRRRREAFARLRAFGYLLRQPAPLHLTVDGECLHTRLVLIANNAYTLHPLSFGERERVDEGRLYLYVRSGARWHARDATRFGIGARGTHVRAAVDGEAALLATPVELTVEPGALRLLLPRGPVA